MGILVQDNPTDWICSSFKILGLDREVALKISYRVSLWIKEEGPEAAVRRLKTIKDAGLQLVANQKVELPWLKHDRVGDPRGPWKPLFVALRKSSYKHKKRALNALLVYTTISFKPDTPPTKTQEQKFLGTVKQGQNERLEKALTGSEVLKSRSFIVALGYLRSILMKSKWDPKNGPSHPNIWSYIGQKYGSTDEWYDLRHERYIQWDKRVWDFVDDPDFYVFLGFPQVREVLADVIKVKAFALQQQRKLSLPDHDAPNFIYEWEDLGREYALRLSEEEAFFKAVGAHFVFTGDEADGTFFKYDSEDLPPPFNERLVELQRLEADVEKFKSSKPPSTPIGSVNCVQEPGCKLRGFASPHVVLQASLERLKWSLDHALSSFPWDCTHDQYKGVEVVEKWLREGHECFSVDLSDATNNLPFWLQVMLLQFLGVPQEDIHLFRLVARSRYSIGWTGGMETTMWNWGQPLGSVPSFASMGILHGLLGLAAEISAGIPKKELGTHFVILGDDIVIRSKPVHDAYRYTLNILGVPVSQAKCLESRSAASFAGWLITSEYVFKGWKFKKPEPDKASFMDMVREVGIRAITPTLLSSRQYSYCQVVKFLPPPIGFGFNPRGIPLWKRQISQVAFKEWHDDVIYRRSQQPLATEASVLNSVIYGMPSSARVPDSSFWSQGSPSIWESGFEANYRQLVFTPIYIQKLVSNLRSLDNSPRSLDQWVVADRRACKKYRTGASWKNKDYGIMEDVLAVWESTLMEKVLPILSRAHKGQPISIRAELESAYLYR